MEISDFTWQHKNYARSEIYVVAYGTDEYTNSEING